MPKKLTTEAVNARLSARGISLVGEWQGHFDQNEFQCSKSHTWYRRGNSVVISHTGCPKCRTAHNVLSLEEVTKRLNVFDISLLSEWQGTMEKHLFECSNGHQWITTGNSVLQGHGCLQCENISRTFSNKIVKNLLSKRGISFIGNWVGGKTWYSFKCSKSHTWKARGNSVLQGSGCLICDHDMRKLTKNIIKKRLKPRGITLVGDWNTGRRYNKFTCSLGHEWQALGNNVLNFNTGCPECARLRQKNKATRGF